MNNGERRSILCPNCNKLISRDEPHCPHCGISIPGSFLKKNVWTRIVLNGDDLVRKVIILNAGMFVLSLLMNPAAMSFSMSPLAFLSPDNRSLLLLGASGTIPIDRFHRWWTLLSANYLHGGILHILFNMIAIRQIAPLIFQEYGGYRLIIIYTLSGVGGYVVSYFAGVAFTIGASAALCGLIGSALYFGKSRGGYFGHLVYKQVSGWVIGIFIFGLFFPGINNWAHGGGLVGGILLSFLIGYEERFKENIYHKFLAGLCVLSTVCVLAWAVLSSLYLLLVG